jgi:hypothetical protein
MSSVPIIKFMFSGEWSVLNDALALATPYESESYSAAGDLTTALGMTQAGMVVASLRDKNDLIQLATLMKMLKKLSPSTFVKVIVVNFSGDKQFEKAVEKLGILDLVDARIQTKALRFKIDFMMKSVNVHLKKVASLQANNAVKAVETAKKQENKAQDNAPIWKKPLDNENDIWLLKNESDCKKILTRWLIKMMGPSPYVAQWVESNNPGVWRFDFKSEMETFITGKGSWFYKGDQKPDFIWAENTWSFAGSSFDLFYKEGADVISRLSLQDKQLTIAKNSDYAKTKEQNIIESFDKDLVFRKELGGKTESDTVDKDTERYQNLEGKGKTDALKQNPLSGKGKTSHLNTDPLSMDVNPEDNNLSSDPLSQKGSTSHQSGYMKGKNGSDAAAAGPLSQAANQGINSGENLEMDNKNKHETYYKGHNEAEKFGAKDIGHAIKKDGVAGNLQGKTETDEIEGHLRSPDAKGKGTPAEAKSGEMSGKSFTDNLPAHMKSPEAKAKAAQEEKAEAEKKAGKSFTENLESHMKSPEAKAKAAQEEKAAAEKKAGKSFTDNLESHLKSPEAKAKAKAEAQTEKKSTEMSGKSHTDKLDGHMSGPKNQKDTSESADHAKKEQTKSGSSFVSDDEFLGSEQSGRQNKVVALDDVKKELAARANATKLDVVTKEFIPLEDPSLELADAVQTAVVTSMLSQDLIRVSCKLDDHFDNTIIFSAPKSTLSLEKPVDLNLNFNYMGKNSTLKFAAKISSVDSDVEGLQYITVEISKENVTAFSSFMQLFKTRQQNIDYFLKTVKGY